MNIVIMIFKNFCVSLIFKIKKLKKKQAKIYGEANAILIEVGNK